MSHILKSNSLLARELGGEGVTFLERGLKSISRLLPHTTFGAWSETARGRAKSGVSWASPAHQEICLSVAIDGSKRALHGRVARRVVTRTNVTVPKTLNLLELGICRLVITRVAAVLRVGPLGVGATTSLRAIADTFDEEVLAEHLGTHHGVSLSVSKVLRAIHQLSETTYENSALAFGCIIDAKKGKSTSGDGSAAFLDALVRSKRYRALSDGYRTAYEIGANGKLRRFTSLKFVPTTGKHYSPEWTEWLASATSGGRLGLSLTRNGDILLFANGSMTFAYRYGQWKFWNHSHLINLLTALARVQKVPKGIIGTVVSSVYRAALDVSFRRTGALFLILKNQSRLGSVAREEDRIGHAKRHDLDAALDDAAVAGRTLQSLPRPVVAELASLDGAVVLSNKGEILAYGAVLRPRKQGSLKGTEGSRTKAAVGASHYGLAVKISSDGDISVYFNGREFLKM